MTEKTKTILIIGGVAVVGYLLYKKFTAPAVHPAVTTHIGTGQSISTATGGGTSGSADFWSSLGSVGKGLNSGVSAVESTYNNIYDLFGGNSTSTSVTGNNATAG